MIVEDFTHLRKFMVFLTPPHQTFMNSHRWFESKTAEGLFVKSTGRLLGQLSTVNLSMDGMRHRPYPAKKPPRSRPARNKSTSSMHHLLATYQWAQMFQWQCPLALSSMQSAARHGEVAAVQMGKGKTILPHFDRWCAACVCFTVVNNFSQTWPDGALSASLNVSNKLFVVACSYCQSSDE